MNLDDVLAQWSQDCEISHKLDECSRETPKLHAKYLGYLTQAKLLLKKAESDQQVLLKNKFLWYNGKMSQEEIVELGWKHDPFDGLKVMKGDMNYYYDSDAEIQKSEQKIAYYKAMVDALKEMVEGIKWRHQHIRNIIEVRRFESGG
jgi:hypothetical protein